MSADVSGLKAAIDERAAAIFDAALANIVDQKKSDCPIGENAGEHMVDTIYTTDPSGGAGTLSAELHVDADYASYVDDGADYPIVGQNSPRQMLRFEVGGEVVFRHEVMWHTDNGGWFSRDLPAQWSDAVAQGVAS